jgi:hypothetical protein
MIEYKEKLKSKLKSAVGGLLRMQWPDNILIKANKIKSRFKSYPAHNFVRTKEVKGHKKHRLVLHIGAGKCASSTLQHILSTGFLYEKHSKKCQYISLTPKGVSGSRESALIANKSVERYISSSQFSLLLPIQDRIIRDLSRIVNECEDESTSFVFSCEAWLTEITFNKAVVERWIYSLSSIFNPIEAICIVRPPVEWINSAWWQWGYWDRLPFQEWLNTHIEASLWSNHANAWLMHPAIKALHVLPLDLSAIDSALKIIGIDHLKTHVAENTSIGNLFLRVFKERPELRPGPHSPKFSFFAINEILPKLRQQMLMPWCISQPTLIRILNYTESSSRNLLPLMTCYDAKKVSDNGRWWKPEAYDKEMSRLVSPDDKVQVSDDQIYELISVLMNELFAKKYN